jgi:hypothetical protein
MSATSSSSTKDRVRGLHYSASESNADLNRSLGNILEEDATDPPRARSSSRLDELPGEQRPRKPGSSRGLTRNKSDSEKNQTLPVGSTTPSQRRKEKARVPQSAPTRRDKKLLLSASAHGVPSERNGKPLLPPSSASPHEPRRAMSLGVTVTPSVGSASQSGRPRQRRPEDDARRRSRREDRNSDKSKSSSSKTAMLGLKGFDPESNHSQRSERSSTGTSSKNRSSRRGLDRKDGGESSEEISKTSNSSASAAGDAAKGDTDGKLLGKDSSRSGRERSRPSRTSNSGDRARSRSKKRSARRRSNHADSSGSNISIVTNGTTETESSEEAAPSKPASVRVKSKAAWPDDNKANGDEQNASRRKRASKGSSRSPNRKSQSDDSDRIRMLSRSQSFGDTGGGISGLASFLKSDESRGESKSSSRSVGGDPEESSAPIVDENKRRQTRRARKGNASSFTDTNDDNPLPKPRFRQVKSDEVKLSVDDAGLRESLHIGEVFSQQKRPKGRRNMSTAGIPDFQESDDASGRSSFAEANESGPAFGKSMPPLSFAESLKVADLGGHMKKLKDAKKDSSTQIQIEIVPKKEEEDIFTFYSWSTSRQPRDKILEQRKKFRDAIRQGPLLTSFQSLVRDDEQNNK